MSLQLLSLFVVSILGFSGFSFLLAEQAGAGMFNIPHFTLPGKFSTGIEPELDFTTPTSLAINLRLSYGLNDLNNLHAIVGTGGAARGFRVGGAYTLDFIPDVGSQPGLGIALQTILVQISGTGTVELTAAPYVHKTLVYGQTLFEPFIAYPFGLDLADGMYRYVGTLAVGSLFHHNEHIYSVVELGIKMNNTSTYVSGGVVYYL